MAEQERHDGSANAARGLQGIFSMLDAFMTSVLEAMDSSNPPEIRRRKLARLDEDAKQAARLFHSGKQLVEQVTESLEHTGDLLKRVPGFEQGFQTVTKGLRGIGDLSEEATINIQQHSERLQAALDESVKILRSLADHDNLPHDARTTINTALTSIEQADSDVLDIITALQFQDILRQQLSAVVMILNKTKEGLGRCIELIVGMPLRPWEVLNSDIVTDESVLRTGQNSQDAVDDIIKGLPAKGA